MAYQQEEDINPDAYEAQDLQEEEEEAGVAHLVQGWIQQGQIDRVDLFNPWFSL
jgi:hypothetical protein